MPRALVYCDYNAGAPIRPSALTALAKAAADGGNASSVHGAGRQAKARLEEARETLAAACGAQGANVVFTSGATEAAHLALAASGAASFVMAPLEHDAVWEAAALTGLPVITVAACADARLNLASWEDALARAPKPAFAAVMLANNETGVIQPVAQAAAIVRMHGAMLLVDAAQGLGRTPVDLAALDATYLVVSSHKAGGPAGAGALILAPGAPFKTVRTGGGQERGGDGARQRGHLDHRGFGGHCRVLRRGLLVGQGARKPHPSGDGLRVRPHRFGLARQLRLGLNP